MDARPAPSTGQRRALRLSPLLLSSAQQRCGAAGESPAKGQAADEGTGSMCPLGRASASWDCSCCPQEVPGGLS